MLESQSELQKQKHIVTQSNVFVRTSPAAVEAVNPVVRSNQLRESKEWWKGKIPLHDFQHEFSAPLTGITPSTQVGRLSGSHSDIGFQLTQFPGGRKVENRKVKRSARIENSMV